VQQPSGSPARLRTNHWTPTEVVAQLEAPLPARSTDHLDIYEMHPGSDEVCPERLELALRIARR
jgi:hypothetical protein